MKVGVSQMDTEDTVSSISNEERSKVAYVRVSEFWLMRIIRENVVTI